MPLTFPTHAAAVLPLKLWRPRWFDGVALVTGSAAPDVTHALTGYGVDLTPRTHTVPGVFLWCVPTAMVAAWITRRVAPGIAARHGLIRRWAAKPPPAVMPTLPGAGVVHVMGVRTLFLVAFALLAGSVVAHTRTGRRTAQPGLAAADG